jgi:hypothetical protein
LEHITRHPFRARFRLRGRDRAIVELRPSAPTTLLRLRVLPVSVKVDSPVNVT